MINNYFYNHYIIMVMFRKYVKNVLFTLAVLIILYGAYKALFNVREGKQNKGNAKGRRRVKITSRVDDNVCNDFHTKCDKNNMISNGINMLTFASREKIRGLDSVTSFCRNIENGFDIGPVKSHTDVINSIMRVANEFDMNDKQKHKYLDAIAQDNGGCCPFPTAQQCNDYGYN
jgi:hypothetical protein